MPRTAMILQAENESQIICLSRGFAMKQQGLSLAVDCASSPKRARNVASSVHCCRRSATHLWRNAGPGINYPDRPDLRLRSYAYSRSEAQKWVRLPRCFGEREREREREGERERKRESSSRQGFVSALLAEPAHRCRTVEALPGERAQNPVMPGSSSALARARRAFHRCRRSLQQ